MADAVKVIDKAIAAFNAELYVPTVQCWSCREVIEVSAVGDCDGYCPKCDSPIDLDEEPYDAAILQAGNSPVIPDGWKLVPIVPTEKMVIEGFESEPDEFFSKSEVWEAYQKMSGCEQAAHRAKLCWAAMISAAPQQEVKL